MSLKSLIDYFYNMAAIESVNAYDIRKDYPYEISDQDIDGALNEWLNLGFSEESLDILKRRLHGKMAYKFSIGVSFGGLYKGFDSRYGMHLLEINRLYAESRNTIQHEIRHGAKTEIFRILLDKESEVYDGLDKEEKDQRLMEVYSLVRKLVYENRKESIIRYSQTIYEIKNIARALVEGRKFSLNKAFRSVIRKAMRIEGYGMLVKDLEDNLGVKGVLETIGYGKDVFANYFSNLAHWDNMTFYESNCNNDTEIKYFRSYEWFSIAFSILAAGFGTLMVKFAFDWGRHMYIKDTSLVPRLLLLALISFALSAYSFKWYLRFKNHSNKKMLSDFRSRVQDKTSPYEQFLEFVKFGMGSKE